MNDKSASPDQPLKLAPWVIEGVSAAAVARAESEAERRGLLLVEWIEEAIERALVEEKQGAPVRPGDPPTGET